MMKPSLIATVEQSIEDAAEGQTEDAKDDDLEQFNIAHSGDFSPLINCPTEELNEALGVHKDDPQPDKESLLKSLSYTGFTIALKEEKEGLSHLRLERGPAAENLKTLKVVEKDDVNAKEVEALDFFSKTEVVRTTFLPPNPYAGADNVVTGLEVVIKKGDENLKYCLLSHGYGEWKVFDESKECKENFDSFQVESAEIVREKDKGPYIRLSIDDDRSMFFYPIHPSADGMHRFITE